MHIAILCSGRIQSPNLADSVAHFQALRASLVPHNVAFFFSLNAEITTNADVSAFCTALNIREEDCVSVTANTYPNVQNVSRLQSVWSMYTHNQGAFRVMEAYERVHSLRFDAVVKYRTDIVSDTPPPLPSPLEEGVLYVPQGFDWGGLNDQIAMGSRETMRVYCDCVNALVDLHTTERIRWHPETLLLAYIQRRTKLTVRRFPFPYQLWKNKYKTRRH